VPGQYLAAPTQQRRRRDEEGCTGGTTSGTSSPCWPPRPAGSPTTGCWWPTSTSPPFGCPTAGPRGAAWATHCGPRVRLRPAPPADPPHRPARGRAPVHVPGCRRPGRGELHRPTGRLLLLHGWPPAGARTVAHV